jgi:hypothetical protein
MILDLARNTTVDYEDTEGFTAQLAASSASYNHVDIIRLLADSGANQPRGEHRAVLRRHSDVPDPAPDGALSTTPTPTARGNSPP